MVMRGLQDVQSTYYCSMFALSPIPVTISGFQLNVTSHDKKNIVQLRFDQLLGFTVPTGREVHENTLLWMFSVQEAKCFFDWEQDMTVPQRVCFLLYSSITPMCHFSSHVLPNTPSSPQLAFKCPSGGPVPPPAAGPNVNSQSGITE